MSSGTYAMLEFNHKTFCAITYTRCYKLVRFNKENFKNMKKYKSKLDGKVAIIISDRAAGMCNKTLGMTMVVYKYEGDTYDYPFIMEHREFYQKHSEITES